MKHTFSSRYLTLLLCLFLLCLFFSHKAFSVEFGYQYFASILSSDNLDDSLDSISGTSYDLGVRFDLTNQTSSNLRFDVNGLVAASKSDDDNIETEYFRSLNGILLYDNPASNFSFLALEELTQVPANRFSTSETNNLRDLNVFAAQPSYAVRFSQLDTLNLRYTYINLDSGSAIGFDGVEAIADDSRERQQVSLDYTNRVNSVNSVSMVFERSETDFDEEFEPLTNDGNDFFQSDYFVRWDIQGATNSFRINVGRTEINSDFDEALEVDLYEVLFNRRINRTQLLSVSYRDGVDSLLNFNLDTRQIEINNDQVNFANTLQSTQGGITYSYEETYLTATLRLFRTDLESLVDDDEEIREGGDIGVRYSLSPLFKSPYNSSISVGYSFNRSNFNPNIVDEALLNIVRVFSIRFDYSFNQKMDLFVNFDRRNAISEGTTNAETESNNISIGFRYTPRRVTRIVLNSNI